MADKLTLSQVRAQISLTRVLPFMTCWWRVSVMMVHSITLWSYVRAGWRTAVLYRGNLLLLTRNSKAVVSISLSDWVALRLGQKWRDIDAVAFISSSFSWPCIWRISWWVSSLFGWGLLRIDNTSYETASDSSTFFRPLFLRFPLYWPAFNWVTIVFLSFHILIYYRFAFLVNKSSGFSWGCRWIVSLGWSDPSLLKIDLRCEPCRPSLSKKFAEKT